MFGWLKRKPDFEMSETPKHNPSTLTGGKQASVSEHAQKHQHGAFDSIEISILEEKWQEGRKGKREAEASA